MADRELTPTSYIVLGLLEDDPGTPYELKARVAAGLGNFWTVQHAQLYNETARLAEEGFLDEQIEESGRRRKTYSITKAGRKALAGWREIPDDGFGEMRDPGLLKLYLGADTATIAPGRARAHEVRLQGWEAIKEAIRGADIPEGQRMALENGIEHERLFVKFWSSLL
jgi:PadR family transcriptional regulator, regulatory protein AphA